MSTPIRYPVSRPSIIGFEYERVTRCLIENRLTMGQEVLAFEALFAKTLGMEEHHAVACSSGTAALHLALLAAGVGPGDEVIVPDLTYVATANAVRYVGATPVLVDVDRESWGMDPVRVREEITKRTKALIIVHLYGRPASMEILLRLADRHNLLVIEDAAEGLGGACASPTDAVMHPLGSVGHYGCFSFYANKILTTGEGGVVVTQDPDAAARLRLFRGQGQTPGTRYWHEVVGYNYRMTEIQAAIGIAQLQRIDDLLAARRRVIERYYQCLANILPCTPREAAPWQEVVVLPSEVSRGEIAASLAAEGIETRPTFAPLHRLPMYQWDGQTLLHDANFPIASRYGDRGLCLPTYPDLALDAVDEICDALLRAVEAARG